MRLAIVVPCYNEQAVLEEAARRLSELIETMKSEGRIAEGHVYFVDDGSKDNTWQLIEEQQKSCPYIHGLKLAHNSGHQNAVWAGLEFVADKCDAAVSIDADMQDDVNAIAEMVDKFNNEQCEIVYGVRKKRTTDTFFKRTTALAFYKLMLAMGVDVVYNHADFRMMSRRAIEALMQYPERNIFLRGIVPMIGFKSSNVYYDRSERFAGESKYPFKKMLNFAVDGITSFSVKPLRIITVIGLAMTVVAFCAGLYVLVSYLCGTAIRGWASMLLSVWFIGGIQLLCIGILGEYIGKIYKEVKRRPRYYLEKTV